MRKARSRSQLDQTFFGLTPSHKLVILEEIYQLTRYCNITYTEAWYMPVEYRKWWLERTSKDNKKENGNGGDGHTDPFGRKH